MEGCVKMSFEERTGWRDEALSNRHRTWGKGCAAVDIDFLMLEYNYAAPAALVEYKNEFAAVQSSKHFTYQALAELANRARIPFFACRYASDFSWWKVTPLNPNAKEHIPETTVMTESQWVELLYKTRGKSYVH